VNFTTGIELTLYEVQEALNHLQEQAGHRAEIILGVVNDERLEERVQVILVVTGLGSPTLEDTLSHVDRSRRITSNPETSQTVPAMRSLDYALTQPSAPKDPVEPKVSSLNTPLNITSRDLDLPAFLRRAR
jgi:cell division protein FtsZ